jgi:hypothetical protein
MIVALQGCVIVALQGCVIVALQGCVIVGVVEADAKKAATAALRNHNTSENKLAENKAVDDVLKKLILIDKNKLKSKIGHRT